MIPAAAMVFFDDVKKPRGLVRWLKPDFRHCFVATSDPAGGWNVLEACQHQTFVSYFETDNLVALFTRHAPARSYVETRVHAAPPRAPLVLRPHTCVETVKAVLGIRAWWVLTPWQLYRHLKEATNS